MMRITCPQCGFFRELPDSKVPVTSTMATCPKCRHRFRFRPELTGGRRETRGGAGPDIPGAEALLDEASSWRRPSTTRPRPVEPAPIPMPEPESPPRARSVFAPAPPEEIREPEASAGEPEPDTLPETAYEPPLEPELPPVAPRAARRQATMVDAAPVAPAAPVVEEPQEPPLSPVQAVDPEPEVAAPAAPAEPGLSEPVPSEPVPPVGPEADAHHARSFRPSELLDEVRDSLSEPAPATPPAPEKPAAKSRSWGLGKDGVRDIWARLQAMDETPRSREKTEASEAKPEEADRPTSDPIPWERLDIYGFLPGLGLTLRKILLTPGAFFSEMPEGRPMGKALVFNLLISEFLLILDFLWSLFGLRAKWAASGGTDVVGAMTTSPSLGFLIALLLVPPLLAVGVYLDAWFTHLLLLLFRSANKGFTETFRVLCYSAAPTTLSAVPVAGQLLSPVILVWYMAIQAIGLTRVHKGALTQVLAAIFIKWSVYLFLLLAMLQSVSPG